MSPDTQTAQTALNNFTSSAPTAQTVEQQAQDKYGVSGLTSRLSDLTTGVNNLQSSLNQVDPSVTGRLQGNFATTAQRSALIAKEQAPIASNLATENTALGQGQTALTTASGQATSYANSILNDQSKTYQQLLDEYNAANARDQFAATQKTQADQFAKTQALEQAKLAEQTRVDNMKTSGSSVDIGGILSALGYGGSGGGQPTTKAGMTQRGDNGFNFTDTNGMPISAAQYAKATGQNFRDLLTKMATNGDQGAKTALGFVGNDFGYDPTKIGSNGSLYNTLVGGTGRSYNPVYVGNNGYTGSVVVR